MLSYQQTIIKSGIFLWGEMLCQENYLLKYSHFNLLIYFPRKLHFEEHNAGDSNCRGFTPTQLMIIHRFCPRDSRPMVLYYAYI